MEIDVKGGERDHIKAYHMEERYLSLPRCLWSIEERCHMSSRGERHVKTCLIEPFLALMVLALISFSFFALIFSYPTFFHYPISDLGGEIIHIQGKKIFGNHCISLMFGEMSISKWSTKYSLITCHLSLGTLVVS